MAATLFDAAANAAIMAETAAAGTVDGKPAAAAIEAVKPQLLLCPAAHVRAEKAALVVVVVRTAAATVSVPVTAAALVVTAAAVFGAFTAADDDVSASPSRPLRRPDPSTGGLQTKCTPP